MKAKATLPRVRVSMKTGHDPKPKRPRGQKAKKAKDPLRGMGLPKY